MKTKNICKLTTPDINRDLTTLNFVYETEAPKTATHSYSDRNLLCLVISGEGRYYTDLVETELTAGMIFFILKGKSYEIENTNNLRYMYISFNGTRSNELFKHSGLSSAYPIYFGYEYLIPLWQNSISRINSKNSDLLSESILLYTFSMLSYSKDDDFGIFRDIIDFIDDNFTDYNFSLKDLSEKFGYNTKYLSSLFTKKSGVGFSNYLTTLRMRYALLLIDQGVTSVKNIASLSGYNDSLYFSKVFKKSIGISPKNYIEKNKLDTFT